MKRMNHKKNWLLLAALVLILSVSVGGTVAYLIDRTEAVVNTFEPSQIPTDVTEELKEGVKSNVKVENEGNIKAFIRAQVVVTWQDDSGNICSISPVLNTDYSMSFGTKWKRIGDYYYHNTAVEGNNGTTSALITEAKVLESATKPAGYENLHVEILAQAIQAEGENADGVTPVQDAWGVTISDGTVTEYSAQ